MAAFSGAGSFPYAMTITNLNGGTGSAAVSENIPVTPGVGYQFGIVASYAATWASGAQISLSFYDTAGNVLGASPYLATQANMSGGALYQFNTGLITAPAASSFAIAQIIAVGSPSAANPLSVFQAEINNQSYQQVNINYAFSYTFWPWSPSGVNSQLGWTWSPLLAGDSDSLVIDGQIELMGGAQGVMSTNPSLLDVNGQGPTFRILAPPSMNSTAFGYQSSYDLNAPQPTQDVVATMLLDGERPFGTRASNRTISLPVVIFGTQAGGMKQVQAAREFLMAIIDQQTFTIDWTPADTGLPMMFDCFRALASAPVYGFNYSAGGTATGTTIGRPNYPIAMIRLQIQALPYGRSDIDGTQNLTFSNPLAGGVQAASPVTIDTFGSVFSPPSIINQPTWTGIGTSSPTSVSSFSITTSVSNVLVGDTIVVEIESASANITGVTDSQGNVYTRASVQGTGGACYQYIFTAPCQASLLTGQAITVSASSSGNYSAVAYRLNGAWKPTVIYQGSGTAATFSGTYAVPEYTLVVSVGAGLGSAGGTPTGFTALAGNSGNGFNDQICWYPQPINQFTLSYSVASLPNPYSLTLLAFAPVNQFWNLDTKTAPASFPGNSVHYQSPRPLRKPYPGAIFTQNLATPVSVIGLPVLTVNFGQSWDTQWPLHHKFVSNVELQWTLTDNNGATLSFRSNYKKVPYGSNPGTPKWTRMSAAIPQGRAFNYGAVASYLVRITNVQLSGHSGYVYMHAWLNNIVANPQTIQNAISPRGSVYNLFSLPGSARSPISVQCQLPGAANVVKEITTPASGSWIVPPGVYSVQAEAWGGGGAGAAFNLTRAFSGAGGGGAEYAQEPALPVQPGQRVPWVIGQGGTPGQLAATVVQYAKTGLSHWTCPANVTSVTAECWGGGAAGAGGGGGGGGSEYSRSVIATTPGKTYTIFTGAAGKADTGLSSAQQAARQGGMSWFGPPGATSNLQAYLQAAGGSTALVGSSQGGAGGSSGTWSPASQVLLIGSSNQAAATSYTLGLLNRNTKVLPAGGTGVLVLSVPAAATITVTDSAKNTWTQIASVAGTGVQTYVFASFRSSKLTAQSTVTITQSVSQLMTIGMLSCPWANGIDVGAVTASGSSTAPSVTSGTAGQSNDLVVAIFSSVTANTTSTPAGFTSTVPNLGSSLFVNVFQELNSGTSGQTATSSYAASQNWNAIALSLSIQSHVSGGHGGHAPGPAGGGGGSGGGFNNSTSVLVPGKAGGDSLPFSLVGRWLNGGAGGASAGTGGSASGAGGNGASVPGFPTAGSAPGGGGGGGYQSSPVFTPANPSNILPGLLQANFLGADGGSGMVQLTYFVGSGNPVNGGNTTFGSAGTTGTVVTANGGQSASNNSSAGGTGGSGSANTIHFPGGSGALTTAQASQSNTGSVNSPGAFTYITTLSLPAGTYTVNWTVTLSGTVGAPEANNFLLTAEGFGSSQNIATSVNSGAAGTYVQAQVTVTLPNAGTINVKSNFNNATTGAVYGATVTAINAMRSYMVSPSVTTLFTTLNSGSFTTAGTTTTAATGSAGQGVSVVLVESTALASDLAVTDSAGNIYDLQGSKQAGSGANGVTVYAFVANVIHPILSGVTTLTVTTATAQQYGFLWYASPWLVNGVTPSNSATGNGTGTSFTGQFGSTDTTSIQLELGVVIQDGSTTVSGLTQTKTWFNAGATSSVAAGTMRMSAYVMENNGGGTGTAGTGDVFSGTLSASSNWAVLCVPLTMINQQAAVLMIDWRNGTTPGAQTTWATEAAIQATGQIVVIGMAGSGSSITSAPTAIADAAGNVYTVRKTLVMPSNGGVMFAATAPVTHAMAAGTTGTYNWGTASAAPNYWTVTYWLPNASSTFDGVSSVTGSGTAVSGSFLPAVPNDHVISFAGTVIASESFSDPNLLPLVWDPISSGGLNYLLYESWAAQATDEGNMVFGTTLGSSAPWGLIMLGVGSVIAGGGGGAAAGPNGPGYPGVWQYGGPGFAGGGIGGQGNSATGPGAGASLPGGGGGGAAATSSASAQEGGRGGNGALRLTWSPPLQAFNTLLVHTLSAQSDPNVNPIVPIPITDVMNNAEYLVPSVNGLQNASFSSTYSILLANFSWNSATAGTPRQITVTVNQYEYPGGPRYSVQVSRAVTPATDAINGLVSMGEVTLPIKDYIRFSDQSYFTVSINDTDGTDRFMDVLLLDTLGQTYLINIEPGQPGYGTYVNYFIDEATSDRDLGFVGASVQDRQHQVSVMDYTQISGGALYLGPGDNLFLVYSPSGSPSLAVSYAPRWYLDRIV